MALADSVQFLRRVEEHKPWNQIWALNQVSWLISWCVIVKHSAFSSPVPSPGERADFRTSASPHPQRAPSSTSSRCFPAHKPPETSHCCHSPSTKVPASSVWCGRLSLDSLADPLAPGQGLPKPGFLPSIHSAPTR